MHELSIATSILDLARSHVPQGMVLKRVQVRAGDRRRIEPRAMNFAWRACTLGIDAEGSIIEVQTIPGDDLQLVQIEVDERGANRGNVH